MTDRKRVCPGAVITIMDRTDVWVIAQMAAVIYTEKCITHPEKDARLYAVKTAVEMFRRVETELNK